MAIVQLDPEQVRTMTLEEKDEWWLKNVFRGNMPQLTIRAAITGMIIGGALSLTNLYIGVKTGWTLGVGITSVILAFGFYKMLSSLGLAKDFTILENNAMQSIATAAGYMTSPLTSSVAAYMMVMHTTLPQFTVVLWIISIAILGVLFAFPLKRRFINDEQHPFPEGRAAGVVMDALHTSDAKTGLFKAKLLVFCGLGSALLEVFKSERILSHLKLGFLTIPEQLEAWFFRLMHWQPKIYGVPIDQVTLSLKPEHVLAATGGLVSIRVATSMIIGSTITYFLIAPYVVSAEWITRILLSEGKYMMGYRHYIQWGVWPGAAMLTSVSLLAFFAKPKAIIEAFAGLLGRKRRISDQMRSIELPMSVFVIGIPVFGAITVFLAHQFFGVSYLMGLVAVPLVFVFTLIAVHSTALTAQTPGSALARLTQVTFAALAPNNVATNLATASMTCEVSLNASNLLMDIKPGYMLGAKPRQQAIGHVLGIIAGALVAVPVFYKLYMSNGPQNMVTPNTPFISAIVWQAVAQVLTKGLDQLPRYAGQAALIGACLGLIFEITRMVTRDRFPLSPIGLGLGVLLPWDLCFPMFLGSFVFWVAGRCWKREEAWGNRVVVQNQEPICAGVIAGGALAGVVVQVLEVFVLK